MAIPIVSGSEVSTPASTVPLDSGALRQAALAPGRMAAAIGQDVGGLFQDVSQKIQANRNARTIFDADLSMRKQKDQFTASLAKNPDETTWLPAWKEQVDSLRDQQMSGPNVNPTTKKILSQKFDIWEAATTSEIRTAALLKGTKETRESAIADSTYAAHQGDVEGAQNILKAAVAHYAMSAADAKKIGIKFPSVAAQAQADTAISTNPTQAPDMIKKFEGTIEPRMFVGIMARANEAKNRAQSSNFNDFAEQLANSPDGTLDPKALSAAVKSKDITQRMADGLIQRMQKKNQDQAKDDFNVVMMKADDHDWTDDTKREETAREMREEGAHLPTALADRLNNHLNAKLTQARKEGENQERPVERDTFARMRTDGIDPDAERIKELTRKNSQGEYQLGPEDFKKRYGKTANRESLVRQAQVGQAEKYDKMRAWFASPANKEATEKEAEEYRQSLYAPDARQAVRDALLGTTGIRQILPEIKFEGQK